MEILLIRHGQSEADLLDVHEGQADFNLTPLGVQQAEALALWVKNHYPPQFIWSSPLKRAARVAHILSEQLGGVSVREHQALMEWNNGVLTGMKRDEARRLYPEPANGRRPHEAVNSGESDIEFRSRVEAVWSRILAESREYHRIAVVSHGGTISQLIAAFLRLPVVTEYRFATGDTGCHLLVQEEHARAIRFMNRQDHL